MASQKEKEHTRKIANMMTRGILESFTNGSTPTIKGTLFANEVQEGLEMAQQFGFASNPVIGSNILTTFLGGNRDLGFVTHAWHKDSVPTDLLPGETALYGSYKNVSNVQTMIKIDQAGNIHITAPTIYVNGNMIVNGSINSSGMLNGFDVQALVDAILSLITG